MRKARGIRRGIVGLVVAASAAATLSMGAGAAQASQTMDQKCDSANFCVYKDADYKGTHFEVETAIQDWRTAGDVTARLNDRDSSSYDNFNTLKYACIYKDPYYRGGMTIWMPKHSGRTHHYGNGDKGSSHKGVNTTC
ncbi:peptidase inhibitor family I36 protein [Streptomyces kanamyceticus]|uniref:Peptidase inhibitor family I36 protein n=1 Tax=Streptomyces kanamyceticus TaxID=1967 RepID=A0A5J6GL82_STRKN|nr:peptidase inhibitor family I36 protein [Streptomyces kanamyceticus]QEU96229.1 hypothetical protein CP970_39595 [Streptomyces kanamyceticus]